MGEALKPCVDCGKGLSRTAQVCNQCNSTDPFGGKRLNNKIHLYFVLLVAVILLTAAALTYLDVIDPVEMFDSFIKSLFNQQR